MRAPPMDRLAPLRLLSDPSTPARPATPAESGPILVDARRLAPILCIGVRTLRCWDSCGKLPSPVRVGGKVLWNLDEIREWAAAGAPDRGAWAAMRAAQKK